MRERWRIVNCLWEKNKSSVNKLDLLGQFDYWGHLSAQVAWRQDPNDRPIRVAYTKSGIPTATLLRNDNALLDHTLFWIACKEPQEAHYLLAIINSQALYRAVTPLMPKGQFGARHLQKHLWKLPIPEFDPDNAVHRAVADTGWAAEDGAQLQLDRLRADRGRVSVTVARRELRRWLRSSPEGQAVETAVETLLS